MGRHIVVEILDTETTSETVNTNGLLALAILFPAAFTGATVDIRSSDGAGNFVSVNSLTALGVVVDQWIPLTYTQGRAVGDIFRVVASAQAADRTLKIMVRGV